MQITSTDPETITFFTSLTRFLSVADAEELRMLRVAIDGELARRAGTGLVVTEGGRYVADVPPGGAMLHVSWCTSDGPDETWFPSVDAARAALVRLADESHRAVSVVGLSVDLTPQGCVESSACVYDRAMTAIGGAS
jgi:hypothetical protein